METEIFYSFSGDKKILVKIDLQNEDVTFFNPLFSSFDKKKIGISMDEKNRVDAIKYLLRLAKELRKLRELN